MSVFSPNSKYLPGVLLILLLLSIMLAFRSVHNTLLASGAAIPAGAILFLLLVAILAIVLLVGLFNAQGSIRHLQAEVNRLSSVIQQNKKQEEVKEEVVVKAALDIQAEVKALIPSASNLDIEQFGEALLSNIARRFEIVQGLYFSKNPDDGVFSFRAGYAFFSETSPVTYIEGETLAGQVAKNKTVLNLDKVPDNYITILSGLGQGSPKHLLIVPVISPQNETIGIIELASFKAFDQETEELFAFLGRKLGEIVATPAKPIEE
jgi:hypothetical protein